MSIYSFFLMLIDFSAIYLRIHNLSEYFFITDWRLEIIYVGISLPATDFIRHGYRKFIC